MNNTVHDSVTDTERFRPTGHSAWFRQLLGFHKGGTMFRDAHSDELDEHFADEMTEFPEAALDVARIKSWTRDLQNANDAWWQCKRKKGYTQAGACFEEGEALRRAHWKHQLQIQEAGCEKPLYRYGKCMQRSEHRYRLCRDLERDFVKCTIDSGNMDLMPTDPPELVRLEYYTGFFPWDVKLYRRWIKKRNEFLESHPNWFNDEDVELMDVKQLQKFISRNEEWLNQGDKKPMSTYSYQTRYKEYIPKKDRFVQ